MRRSLRAGASLYVGLRVPNRPDTITVRASLKGLSAGLDALGEKVVIDAVIVA